MIPDPLEKWCFETERIGRRVLLFDSLESTNTTAALLAAHSTEIDGLAIIARHQSAGRGQYGRVWHARPGSSLLLSVVLQPPREFCRPVILTALAAVAVAEAIYGLSSVQARVKWPNDLLVRGKKVCGLLIEQHAANVVIGIGLNLFQNTQEFEAADLREATSLALIAGRQISVRDAAKEVLSRLDYEYYRLLAGQQVAIEADWKWRIGLLGRQVEVELMDGAIVTGRLQEMSFEGLELEVADGLFRLIVPETVGHLRGR